MGTPEISAGVGMKIPAGELGLSPGIPGFWCVFLTQLPCWTNLLTSLALEQQDPFRNLFCLFGPVLPGPSCLLSEDGWSVLGPMGATKPPKDRSQSKEENGLMFMFLLPSWFPSQGASSRKHLAEPISFLLTISVLLQVVELSIPKVKLKTAS